MVFLIDSTKKLYAEKKCIDEARHCLIMKEKGSEKMIFVSIFYEIIKRVFYISSISSVK